VVVVVVVAADDDELAAFPDDPPHALSPAMSAIASATAPGRHLSTSQRLERGSSLRSC
jgi:hypothetical protein